MEQASIPTVNQQCSRKAVKISAGDEQIWLHYFKPSLADEIQETSQKRLVCSLTSVKHWVVTQRIDTNFAEAMS